MTGWAGKAWTGTGRDGCEGNGSWTEGVEEANRAGVEEALQVLLTGAVVDVALIRDHEGLRGRAIMQIRTMEG